MRNADGDHGQIFIDGELFEIGGGEAIFYVGEGGQAQIRFVDAVLADGIVEIHAEKGRFDFVAGGLEGGGQEAFDDLPDALGLGVAHFKVDLGEFGLAIGAQIFVAEAADDLKIFIEARDHQNLLEQLRRLRQGVKHAGLDAAGDEIIAGAFGGGAGHERGFDFEEALGCEVVADGERDFVTQFDIGLHGVAAQVDVTIFQAHLFVREHSVGRQKRQRFRHVQNAQLFDDEFDFSGGDVGVDGVGVAALDGSDGRDHELVAQRLGLLVHGCIQFVVEDDLGHAGAVAEVDEDDLAEVAAAVDPSHEHNFFARIGEPKFSVHMSPSKIA